VFEDAMEILMLGDLIDYRLIKLLQVSTNLT